ncbi:exodeoxyribonuclease VII small subunit [Gemmatimonas sp.]|jgi:exodeoxyribonuclease VII small subunit|uniref:exodeoxyribonuclease VII small subunit n=1 Tax=Gemmatimonas sp. TaxID=1962908 RepID=UPI0022C83083|nr:exodeoxyribonuclease VII small subunit [Gemmatimonas sp.]MCZ8205619.1 exodeoxyribonuclease VII small subunit [Gemmatimonas sp.]
MTELPFEQSLARLEDIVRVLERNDLDLEQALRLFEEGIGLLRSAGSALKAVDARVQQLVEAADGSFSVVDLGA